MTPTALSMTRVIRAPRDRVFLAWTDPESLRKWWGPGPVVCPEAHIDLREGGQYRIANRHPDGSITWISGVFERVSRPEQLIYTWSVSAYPGDPTLVTLDFNEHPQGTQLVLSHERFTDAATRDMHMQGWEGCLVKLEALLAP